MMEQNLQPKWEGKVSTKLANATVDQIWPFYKDFFNFHKWFPNLTTCYGVHGTNGEVGCVRYCSGFSVSSKGNNNNNDDNNNSVKWSKERLIDIDHVGHSLSYELVDSNIGFTSYKSTFKIIPITEDGQDGCMIGWSFTVDPIQGWKLEDLIKKYEVGLQCMSEKMEFCVQ